MAETWGDWFYGSPQQASADAAFREREYRAITASPEYRQANSIAGDEPFYVREMGRTVDPRELRMAMLANAMPQNRIPTTDAMQAQLAAIDYVLAAGQRMRDTSLRGVQELSNGNVLGALDMARRSPMAVFYPPAAAGTPGAPDDWRPKARAAGVPESHILAFDVGTDPENWVTAPVRGPAALVVPGFQVRALQAMARSDAALKALQAARRVGRAADELRYGKGIPTYLEYIDGTPIRRVANTPDVPYGALRRLLPAPQ